MKFLKDAKKYQKIFLPILALLILVNGILAGLFVLRLLGQPY